MWQCFVLPVVVVGLLAVLLLTFVTLDELFRLEYTIYRPVWEKDGRPRGVFWNAPENRKWFGLNLRSEWAFQSLSLIWLFSTPEWMRQNVLALRLLRRFRLLVLLWDGSIIAIIVFRIITLSQIQP